jgi:hypothetical protein
LRFLIILGNKLVFEAGTFITIVKLWTVTVCNFLHYPAKPLPNQQIFYPVIHFGKF